MLLGGGNSVPSAATAFMVWAGVTLGVDRRVEVTLPLQELTDVVSTLIQQIVINGAFFIEIAVAASCGVRHLTPRICTLTRGP